jgi:hypothetical protein
LHEHAFCTNPNSLLVIQFHFVSIIVVFVQQESFNSILDQLEQTGGAVDRYPELTSSGWQDISVSDPETPIDRFVSVRN